MVLRVRLRTSSCASAPAPGKSLPIVAQRMLLGSRPKVTALEAAAGDPRKSPRLSSWAAGTGELQKPGLDLVNLLFVHCQLRHVLWSCGVRPESKVTCRFRPSTSGHLVMRKSFTSAAGSLDGFIPQSFLGIPPWKAFVGQLSRPCPALRRPGKAPLPPSPQQGSRVVPWPGKLSLGRRQ